MRHPLLFSLFILILLLTSCVASEKKTIQVPPSQPSPPTQQKPAPPVPPSGKVVVITMIAKKFEFVPGEIRVKKGDQVRLKVKSVDVPHGIAIREYDINVGLPVNEEKTIEFVADKTGTFEFYCSVYCGSGHGMMRGKLLVD